MALQELCLSTIAASIDRYYHAYSSTDNVDLQLKFQFLRKFFIFIYINGFSMYFILPVFDYM